MAPDRRHQPREETGQQTDVTIWEAEDGIGAGSQGVRELCEAELSEHDLQYLAYYVQGVCHFHIDVLEAGRLSPYFVNTDREERRSAYERAGRRLEWLINRLNASFKDIEGGQLIRTVLDVEKGAVYYFLVDWDKYLIGVTLDQPKVNATDRKLSGLVDMIRTTQFGLPPISQLER
ncbi:hypothetical protein [Flindersiella endophytica]